MAWLALALWAIVAPLPVRAGEGEAENLPLCARRALHEAFALMDAGKAAEGVALLEKLRTSDGCEGIGGGLYLVHFAEGNARHAAGDEKGARICFLRAADANPAYQSAWRNLAVLSHQAEAPEEAAGYFLRAYETGEEPEGGLLLNAAVSWLSAGNNARAADAFERFFKAHPDKVDTHVLEYAVHSFLGTERMDRALALMENLVRTCRGEKRRQWREHLLHQYLAMERHGKALAMARQLTEEEPGERRWWLLLANLQLSRDRMEEALAALIGANAVEPWTLQERFLVADIYLGLDVPSGAIRVLEGVPDGELTTEAAIKIVYAWRRQLCPQKALAVLDAHTGKFGRTEAAMLRADLLYEQGRYREALEAYEQAANGENGTGRAWLMAGYAALAAGEREVARRAFGRAAEDKSLAAEARDMMRRI